MTFPGPRGAKRRRVIRGPALVREATLCGSAKLWRLREVAPGSRIFARCARSSARWTTAASERNLVVEVVALGARHRRLALARRGRSRRAEIAGLTGIGPGSAAPAGSSAIEHGELRVEALQHHLGRIAVLALRVLPFAGLQLALEIDLGTLLEILLGDPAKPLVEDHDPMPLGPLPAFAGRLVAPAVGRRPAQVRHRPAVLGAADFRIRSEIADQDHLVHATRHECSPIRRS